MTAAWPLTLARGDDWISIIVFVLFVVSSLIAQGVKKAKANSEAESPAPPPRTMPPGQRPAPAPQRPVAPPSSPDDEIRKFLEALGKPKTAPSSPPVLRPVPQPQLVRRPMPVPRQPTPVVITPVPQEEEEGPKEALVMEGIAAFEPIQQLDVGKEMRAVEAQVEKTAKGAFTQTTTPISNRAGQFAKLLQDTTNVRRAIVMAEIVGPPLALR